MDTTENRLLELQRQTTEAILAANQLRENDIDARKADVELRQREIEQTQLRIETEIARNKTNDLLAQETAAARQITEKLNEENQRKNNLMETYLQQTEVALKTIDILLKVVETNTQEVRQLLSTQALTMQRWEILETLMQERLAHIYQCLLLFVSKLPDQKGIENEINKLRRNAQPIVNVGTNMMTGGDMNSERDINLRGE
jgi:chromosome segregation protein